MKNKWIAVAVLVAVLVVAAFAQTAQRSSIASSQRYQLLSAQVEEQTVDGTDVPAHVVFLLDTQSGKVFRYQDARLLKGKEGEKPMAIHEKFYPVEIEH